MPPSMKGKKGNSWVPPSMTTEENQHNFKFNTNVITNLSQVFSLQIQCHGGSLASQDEPARHSVPMNSANLHLLEMAGIGWAKKELFTFTDGAPVDNHSHVLTAPWRNMLIVHAWAPPIIPPYLIHALVSSQNWHFTRCW